MNSDVIEMLVNSISLDTFSYAFFKDRLPMQDPLLSC